MSRWIRIIGVAVIVLLIVAICGTTSRAATTKTLDNLLAAYNGESNANAKYVEFAKKADQEGYAAVAVLFRAAAQAEKIHANNHAEVIRKLGGVPKADIKLPEIKATADNLKTAVDGETYELTKMYPEFIAEARATGNKDAVRTFNFAMSAEGEHARLYATASKDLAGWKTAKPFYVCPVCGKTVSVVDFEKCPVCFTPKDKYVKVG